MTLDIPFDNSYARLPRRFFAPVLPQPVSAPALVALNVSLARDLGLDAATLATADGLAMLSGSAAPANAAPLAQAYAGHQFGGWVPQLGDGRAMLLGEIIDPDGTRWDIQLKGSGPTPFSRRGDGRAALGPVLREYLVSEAMHALAIPTTRALAAVTTGQNVLRERPEPGAVLTRVAQSHIRVGTFQYFAARGDLEALDILLGQVITRHYPQARTPLEVLQAVVARQAALIAQWMGVGFIHGVMNTDNTHVGGLTIDYGPCAFLDGYQADKVFSSIDRQGRYAYDRQPDIVVWNLAQFATCLIPLMGKDRDAAIREATGAVAGFGDLYREEYLRVFRAKLGLSRPEQGDAKLIAELLDLMAREGTDFTNGFRALARGSARDQFIDRDAYDAWHGRWLARGARDAADETTRLRLMRATSPAVIPRNHRIEQAINAAENGDFAPFHRLNAALARPYDETAENADLRHPPSAAEVVHHTFCGT